MAPKVPAISPSEVETPRGLSGYSLHAWTSVLRSLPPSYVLTHADMLSLEAACRAWARWKSLEEQIATLSSRNAMAGELAKGKDGRLEESALRRAANSALDEFRVVAKQFGVAAPDWRVDVPETDLFGYPDRPGRGQRGRPKFIPSMQDRNRVRLLLALGWSKERIASAVEVSVPTLNRYFKVELKERAAMRDRLDARRFELAMEAANSGNIAALKELGRMLEQSDTMRAEKRLGAPENAERLGKKEIDAEQARSAEESLFAEIEEEAKGVFRH